MENIDLKKKAEEEALKIFNEDGILSYHNTCYSINWLNATEYENMLVDELAKLCYPDEPEKIIINKSETADSRTCDFKNVNVETLLKSTKSHISDVRKGIDYIIKRLEDVKIKHDETKISHIEMFHKDFTNGFETQDWRDMHIATERHHVQTENGVREDVDLIDIIECVVDCAMAGMARSGSVRPMEIPAEVLLKATQNTLNKLYDIIVVENNN